MNDSNYINLKKLEILISELQRNEKNENITVEELLKLYREKFNKEFIQNENSTQKQESFEIETRNQKLTYLQKQKEMQEKINCLGTSEFTTELAKKIHRKYRQEFIELSMDKSINRKIKLKKLNELGISVDRSYQELKQIENQITELKQKIMYINTLCRYNKTVLEIYQPSELLNCKNKIDELLKKSDIEPLQVLKEFSDISENLENIKVTLKKIGDLNKYRNPYPVFPNIHIYNINGIIITVDTKEKIYKITFNENIINILKKCKVSELKKQLEERLKNVSFDEIIEPKYVNENKILEYINNNNIPLKEILKFDINGLVRYLSLNNEMKELPSIKDLSEENEELKMAFEFIQILKTQGFEIYLHKEKKLHEDVLTKYHSINLESIEDIYKQISPIIQKNYPNELLIYSSLQNVYNCININLRKRMHKDLSNNKSKKESDSIKEVIEFIKKYSRNKDGKKYSDEEIINFLKQKNEIISTQLKNEDIEPEYYQDLIDNIEITDILYKLTGRHR